MKKTIAATVFVVLALQMPAFAGADFDHAVQLYNQKQYRPALDLFLRAASTEPKNAGTYFYAANCFYQLGNMTRAIQTYNMVVQYYPNSPQAVMAKDFLDRVASAQAAKEQKQSEKKQVADVSPSAPEKVAKEESKEPIDCRDLLVIVRPQKDRPPVSDELTAAMKSKLSSMPHDVGKLLHERKIKVHISTSMIDARPDLANEEGRGYEGATYKSCPGMFCGDGIFLAEHAISESDETLRPAIPIVQVINTFDHECGHALDWCLDNVSETGEYQHVYLLDCGNVTRNAPEAANELRYYMQKSEAGQQECCGELIGALLGKSDTQATDLKANFPLTLKFLKDKLKMQ